MPEQKTVSPLLDGLTIGAPMGAHNGISCSPAIKGNSDQRCIVKCIRLPQSPSQVDALLITGALRDAAAADDYFREQAEEIFQEAELLRILARDEGFLPFDGCQYVPMGGDQPGYEVYLLSPYRLSLEKYMRRKGMTHLEAVNLGIDLCAALAASRRSGLMYIDLKPGNIFITPKKEYKIGDLGFASMVSLRYSSMPVKYRSPYTAPEALDDMEVLNETVDTYAVGMLLYQIFNFGILPRDRKELSPPSNGDEELNAILLKACACDPSQRYSDPTELWNALIAYMQRNTINNTSIMPPLVPSDSTGTLARFELNPLKKEEPQQEQLSEEPAAREEAPEQETPEEDEPEEEEPEEDEPEVQEPEEEDPSDSDLDFPEEPLEEEDLAPNPAGVPSGNIESELEEVNRLLSSEGAMPKLKSKKHSAPVLVQEKKKSGFVGFLKFLLILVLLAGLGFGGWYGYENYYLQYVDLLSVEGSDSQITVSIVSDIPDRLLTVACVDAYGATSRENVHGGTAVFSDLKPGSLYKIQVEIDGFHRLTGQVSDIFTTESVTKVASFTAVTGSEDGELMLNLSVEGHVPDQWTVTYSSETAPEQSLSFSGYNASVTGLNLGETYHFTLSCGDGSPLNGQNTLDVLVSGVITAQNLRVDSVTDGVMKVIWDAAGEAEALGWRARCYSDSGYDETIEVSDPEAFFSGIDSAKAYTVEVTAEGMSQPARTTITANPITIKQISVDSSAPNELTVSWETADPASQNEQWLLLYSIDGNAIDDVIKCEGSSATISPKIPGAVYRFTLATDKEVTLFNSEKEFSCPAANRFVGHAISSYKISAMLLPTPNPGWSYYNTPNSAFTDQFAPGQSISMVLKVDANFYLDDDPVQLLYVVRDEQGKVVPELTLSLEANWAHLWAKEDYHYAELNTTKAPTVPGNYTLDLYFDGGSVTSSPFTVS